MDNTTKFFLVILALLFLLPDSLEPPAPTNLYAQELEAKSIAVTLSALPNKENAPSEECNCNKSTGKISYDGGTSFTDCPCKNSDCGCKKASDPPKAAATVEDVDYSKYYIIKYTAKWCGPCQVWDSREVQVIDGKKYLKKNNNVQVVEIDSDKSPDIIRRENINRIPSFQICRVEGAVAYPQYKYTNVSADFLLSKIRELDASLAAASSAESYGRYTKDELDALVRASYTKDTPLREAIMADNSQVWSHLVNEHGFLKEQVEGLEMWVALALHDAIHPPTISITPWRK